MMSISNGTLWQDVRYAARQLRLNPAFAIVSILSLALGIGANTAIFQLLDAVRLRSLPVAKPQELAEVQLTDRRRTGNFTGRRSQLTNPQWEQIRDRQEGFSSVFAWGDRRFNLAAGGEVRYVDGLFVSGDFFRTLEVPAILGRVLTTADDRRGCGSPGAVISYGFWQKEFGGSAAAIGKKLTIEGHPVDIIGVTPAGFFGVEVGHTFDVAVPICAQPALFETSFLDKRHFWWLAVIGRLKPDWTLARATAQLQAVSPGIFEATVPPSYRPDTAKSYRAFKLQAIPAGSGVSRLRRSYETPLQLLLAIAGLVLLIACANLANLMLARASAREREIAIRLAIGASRGQLIRQLLVESLLVAAGGAALGALLARNLSGFLVGFLSTKGDQLFLDLGTDWRVLGFTAALAVCTCLLFGLTPALRATRAAPADAMKAGGRGQTAAREKFGLRRALVVSQVAMSLVLLAGALLFGRSLRHLMTLDAGFRQEGVLVMDLDARRLKIPAGQRGVWVAQLLDRIRHAPGVESAAITSIVPGSGNNWNENMHIDGPGGQAKGTILTNINRVSARYFATMGTPILSGRDFNDGDTITSPEVVIIDEAFAKKFLDGTNPIGRTFRSLPGPGEKEHVYQVAGLVKNSKYSDLREEFSPTVFMASEQEKNADLDPSLVLRSQAPIEMLITSAKRAVTDVSPEIAIQFRVLTTQIRDSLVRERLMAMLSGFFGGLAALLATIGIYGVISYMVTRRQNEIGIRMAVGADGLSILKLILREAGLLLGIGLVLGVALTVMSGKAAASMLYGVKPGDAPTIAMACAALAASYVPARRAARLDPMRTLREE